MGPKCFLRVLVQNMTQTPSSTLALPHELALGATEATRSWTWATYCQQQPQGDTGSMAHDIALLSFSALPASIQLNVVKR